MNDRDMPSSIAEQRAMEAALAAALRGPRGRTLWWVQ